MSIVAKWLDGSRRHLAERWALVQATLCKMGSFGTQLQSPILGPFLLWPNGWMHQDATWYAGRPHPRRHCVRWGPSSLSPKRGRSPLPIDDSFLDIPVHEWKQSESYQTAASTVCNIPCVNDIAERGVALIQTFSSTLQPRMRLKAVHVASHRAASATVSKLQS